MDDNTPRVTFGAGVGLGVFLAVGATVVVDRITNHQAQYWRAAFCMEADPAPDFCVMEPQYQYYLETMDFVLKSMEADQ